MHLAKSIFPIFLVFVILSLIVYFFFQNSFTSVLQQVTLPIQKWVYSTLSQQPANVTPQKKLQEENNALRTRLAKTKELERDNKALRDQFQISDPSPRNLLPATVVGESDDKIFIDKGEREHVQAGHIVIFKDNLIGKVTKTSPHVSVITLISHPTTSFIAQTVNTEAIGVIKAQGNESITFENVVLSDKLEKDDIIVTKGDRDDKEVGFPPKLVVGKVVSVNKKASSLFQAAQVKSLVNFETVRMVFVVIREE